MIVDASHIPRGTLRLCVSNFQRKNGHVHKHPHATCNEAKTGFTSDFDAKNYKRIKRKKRKKKKRAYVVVIFETVAFCGVARALGALGANHGALRSRGTLGFPLYKCIRIESHTRMNCVEIITVVASNLVLSGLENFKNILSKQ